MEKWKKIKGFEGRYEISNFGKVKSLPKIVRRNHHQKEIILKNYIVSNGYERVILYNNGKSSPHSIHRLVGEAFIPNPFNKLEINHRNGIKSDNYIKNLEWVTRSENAIHSYKNKLQIPLPSELNGNAKLKQYQIIEIRKKYIPWIYSLRKLAEEYNVSISTISFIINNKTWNEKK